MNGKYKLLPLTADELRDLLGRREEILVAEERAAVQAAPDEAGPELRDLAFATRGGPRMSR